MDFQLNLQMTNVWTKTSQMARGVFMKIQHAIDDKNKY